MNKKKILTGLQPTGTIHIGNYIGAITQMVRYQDEFDSYIFVADLHAITIPQDPKTLSSKVKSLLALYLACGIDPKKNTIFIQSENEYHANISWLLECNTYYGELSRMTQFKDKSLKNMNFTSGLLTYPVLMTADILAYDINYVPVGGDQKQHVELARDIAERFNKKYGKTFIIPEPLIPEDGARIMDLIDPTKKMSKSSENQKGVINLLDDKEDKPGISNLINIYKVFANKTTEEVEEEFKNSNYGEFKKQVAEVVINEIDKIQKKYNQILNSNEIDKILDQGIEKARKQAKEKYELMKDKMGFGR